MTPKEKAILLRAAELVDKGNEIYSCTAISAVSDRPWEDLRFKYCQFYNFGNGGLWPGLDTGGRSKENSHWRVLLLLWFREVGMEGIGEK